MQFTVTDTNPDTKEETIKEFPNFEELRKYVWAKNQEGFLDLLIKINDRVVCLEEAVGEDEYCDEDRPIWFIYTQEDWLDFLKEYIPLLSMPKISCIKLNRYVGDWLNEDFSDYEIPGYWEESDTSILRSGDNILVRVGFYNVHSGNDTCSATFVLYSPLPAGE